MEIKGSPDRRGRRRIKMVVTYIYTHIHTQYAPFPGTGSFLIRTLTCADLMDHFEVIRLPRNNPINKSTSLWKIRNRNCVLYGEIIV